MPKRIIRIRGQQPPTYVSRTPTSLPAASSGAVWLTYEPDKHDLVVLKPFDTEQLHLFYRMYADRPIETRELFHQLVNRGALFDNYGPSQFDNELWECSHYRLRDASGVTLLWHIPRECILNFDTSW